MKFVFRLMGLQEQIACPLYSEAMVASGSFGGEAAQMRTLVVVWRTAVRDWASLSVMLVPV